MHHKLILAFALALFIRPAEAQYTQLTATPESEYSPAWEPFTGRIAFGRETSPAQRDIYVVQSDGSGEQLYASGPATGGGLANSLFWFSVGLLCTTEKINVPEYLVISESEPSATRTVPDGIESGIDVFLTIDGSGGGDLVRVSRFTNENGQLIFLVRYKDASNAVTIRTGDFLSFEGDNASEYGTVRIAKTYPSGDGLLEAALTADGSKFVIAIPSDDNDVNSPHDLWVYTVDNSVAPQNITGNAAQGIDNRTPDIALDSRTIVYSRRSGAEGAYDLYTLDIEGGKPTQVTDTPFFSETHPSWSILDYLTLQAGKVAFVGQHLPGRETEFPALNPGATANADVWVFQLEENDFPGAAPNVVTPKTVPAAPVVTVDNETGDATLLLELFEKAQKGGMKKGATAAAKRKKLGFRYEVSIKKELDELGRPVKSRTIKRTTKRNEITIKNLSSGQYSAKYRVRFTSGKGASQKTVGFSKPSPTQVFSVSRTK